jgi:hypothetical protein
MGNGKFGKEIEEIEMDGIIENGFQLKCTGRIVTSADLDTLTKSELEELLSSPVSAWEILTLHKYHNHLIGTLAKHIKDETQEFVELKTVLRRIADGLVVKVKNGEEHEYMVGELIVDLYNSHKAERKRSRLWDSVKENKIPIIITSISLIFASFYYHPYIIKFFSRAEDWVLPALGAGIVAPLIVMVLGSIFKKIIKA